VFVVNDNLKVTADICHVARNEGLPEVLLQWWRTLAIELIYIVEVV